MNPSKLSVLPPELLSALEAQPDLRLAVVFGSVARGQAGPESDLDIAVLADGPVDAPRREALIRVLAQASGRPVDLVDLWSADVLVSREALGHGVVALNRDAAAYYHLLSKMVTDAEDFLPLYERLLRHRNEAWLRSS